MAIHSRLGYLIKILEFKNKIGDETSEFPGISAHAPGHIPCPGAQNSCFMLKSILSYTDSLYNPETFLSF